MRREIWPGCIWQSMCTGGLCTACVAQHGGVLHAPQLTCACDLAFLQDGLPGEPGAAECEDASQVCRSVMSYFHCTAGHRGLKDGLRLTCALALQGMEAEAEVAPSRITALELLRQVGSGNLPLRLCRRTLPFLCRLYSYPQLPTGCACRRTQLPMMI